MKNTEQCIYDYVTYIDENIKDYYYLVDRLSFPDVVEIVDLCNQLRALIKSNVIPYAVLIFKIMLIRSTIDKLEEQITNSEYKTEDTYTLIKSLLRTIELDAVKMEEYEIAENMIRLKTILETND